MQRIATVWAELDNRRKAILAMSALAVVGMLFLMIRLASAPSLTLLYAGLEQGAAGDVINTLDQRGAIYEVRGGSIFVEASERDQLRMTLASEGLPANGAMGYELLDGLNGFGTTSQMFDAAYWRAKEGELARTIVTNPFVSQARVHIANTGTSPFARTAKPTASVSITTSGGLISADQAKAFQHLVASAVSGLAVEDVTIIDSNGTLLGSADTTGDAPSSDQRTDALRERVLRLVEARVGNGNAVVEVSVDTVTETEAIRERRFDPDGRVAISTDTEERNNTSSEQADGVTVASNLPDGDAAEGESARAETSETRERVNYEVSETEREIIRAAGAIRRLTVAVLVNGVTTIDASGAPLYENRSEEELNILRDLIASAVGFDADRGDVITIHSMELPTPGPEGTAVTSSLLSGMAIDVISLIQMAVLALVTLILALFVLRPLLTRSPNTASDPLALPSGAGHLETASEAMDGELTQPGSSDPIAMLPDADWRAVPQPGGNPVERLRVMIGERQEETVEILRDWLEEKEDAQ